MRRPFLRHILFFLLALQTGAVAAASNVRTACLADLQTIAEVVTANDAGARDHLAHHGPAIARAFEAARSQAGRVEDVAACDAVLQTYLRAWRPTHFQLIPAAGTANPAPAVSGADDRMPRIRLLGPDTALVVLPTFNDGHADAIRTLLAERRADLAARKHWIVDVRANDGGSDASFAPLLPWLLDGHLVQHGVEYLVTPANIQAQQDVCALTSDAARCAQQVAPIVATMRAGAPGSFVLMGAQRVASYPVRVEAGRPARVAVLTDRACGSSCEQFVLAARTGLRVKIVGRPTMGALDYSNLRPHALASGRMLFYATSRSTRLPDMPVDATGIAPDILLPAPQGEAGRDDEVRRVQAWLEGGPLQ